MTLPEKVLPEREVSEKEQMERLKNMALMPITAPYYDIAEQQSQRHLRLKTVDAVAAFGGMAVPVLLEISQRTNIYEIRESTLDWIAKLKHMH